MARGTRHLVEISDRTEPDRPLDEREPALVRAARDVVEQSVRAPEPTARDRVLTAELDEVRGQPGRHPPRPADLTAPAIRPVGPLREPRVSSASCSQ